MRWHPVMLTMLPPSSLFFLVSVASALVLDTPSGWQAGEAVTERWQTEHGDPAQFNLELSSAQNNGNGNRVVAQNVRTANGAVSFRLPNVSAG